MAVTGVKRSRPALSPTSTFGNRRARGVHPAQAEPCCQRLTNKGLHLRDAQAGNPIAETSYGPPGDAAGNNSLKPLHGATHIQSNPVLGDPAPAPHTDGRHLALSEPDPCESGESLAFETELSQHIDHHMLQLTQVPMQIHAVAVEIQHRINHKLTGTVMGDLPTAIDAVQRGRGVLRIEEEVGFRCTTPQGVTGRMLQQPNGSCLRRIEALRLFQQALLPTALPSPGLCKRHQARRLEKKCRRPCSGIGRRL